jgi:integrase
MLRGLELGWGQDSPGSFGVQVNPVRPMDAIDFREFRSRLLAEYREPVRAAATRQKMDQVLRQVAALGVESTADLTQELVIRYIVGRMALVCGNTVRGELDYLRAAINWAIDEGYLDRGPRWKRIRPRRSTPKLQRVHTIAQVSRVLAYLRVRAQDWQGHRTYALACLLAMAGPRRNEALYSWVADFDLAGRIWYVSDRTPLKTEGSAGPVPLCPELLLALEAWLPRAGSKWAFPHRGRSGPWTSGGKGRKPSERLVAAGNAVGVSGFTAKSLRHTFATWGRRRWGISGLGMRDILRHKTRETQDWYVHREEELEELVRLVRHVRYDGA